mmetsp:Transcript_4505/g.6582  ORF Transcript_4505/g.6582 Transcript_4505/m.6582 type:complete len:492 (+) Transcript_4505:174-1649(+)
MATATAAPTPCALSAPKLMTKLDPKTAEVPIFLRKTYHMIDSCDANVACWSEDGKTFIVKKPTEFEKIIIPQFFKHSKFTSFVRQLNFYGFRKIKFTESIRIDAQLEAQTANFWRFRHENFVKGRPDLLVEIKRSNSTAVSGAKSKKPNAKAGKTQSAAQAPSQDVTELKSELEVLKGRIAKMTNNIDELTSMVKVVSLKEKDTEKKLDAIDESKNVGSKRKKVGTVSAATRPLAPLAPAPVPVAVSSADMNMVVDEVTSSTSALPISVPSASALDSVTFTPDVLFPQEPDPVLSGGVSNAPVADSEDQAFVDELFNAFGDSEDITMEDIVPDLALSGLSGTVSPLDSPIKQELDAMVELATPTPQHPNAPDEKLMHNLSDALTVLPKDIQELLVNRLIATITSSDTLKSHLDSVKDEPEKSVVHKVQPLRQQHLQVKQQQHLAPEHNPEIALPLAAATLTALMTQFSSAMKDGHKTCVKPKSLPVIPIHA